MKRIILYVILSLAIVANAGTIYLSPKGKDSNNGRSWTDAVKTLPVAVERAKDGDIILVQSGTYSVKEEIEVVDKALSIYGGCVGTENRASDRPELKKSKTTIFSGASKSRIFKFLNNDNSREILTKLDRITFTKCSPKFVIDDDDDDYYYDEGYYPDDYYPEYDYWYWPYSLPAGGAIVTYNYSLDIDDCVFSKNSISGNYEESAGGAIASWTINGMSTLLIENTTFVGNKVSSGEASGGAIFIEGDVKFDISNSSFMNNSAVSVKVSGEDDFEAEGGAICVNNYNTYNEDNNLIKNCTFTSNSVSCPTIKDEECIATGGAISANGTRIEECTFTKNSSKGGFAIGGAIRGQEDEIKKCKFESNTAATAGGAVASISVGLGCGLEDCHFKANSAKYGGAFVLAPDALGADSYGSANSFTNCFFESNKASVSGGAIYVSGTVYVYPDAYSPLSDVGIYKSFFYKNSAANEGSAIALENATDVIHPDYYRLHKRKLDFSVWLDRCTIYQNSITGTKGFGSAVYAEENFDVGILENILWENTTKNKKYPVDVCESENLKVDYSIVQEVGRHSTCKVADPLIMGVAQWNGLKYLPVSKKGAAYNGSDYIGGCDRDFSIKTKEPESASNGYVVRVGEGKTVKFTTSLLETLGKVSYQWEVSSDGGVTWKNSSSKKDTLSIKATANNHNYQYRCKITFTTDVGKISDYSVPETLYVVCKTKITAQPKAFTGYEGNDATFSIKAVGEDLKYQWQYSATGKANSWKNIDGETETTLTRTIEGSGYYRCVITGSDGGSATSKSVKLTSNARAKANGISVVQEKKTIFDSDEDFDEEFVSVFNEYPIEMKVKASGKSIKYQWYRAYNELALEDGKPVCVNGKLLTVSGEPAEVEAIKGATKSSYKFTPTTFEDKVYYFCKVCNGNDANGTEDLSRAILLDVKNSLPKSLANYSIKIYELEENFGYLYEELEYMGVTTSSSAIVFGDVVSAVFENTSYSYKRLSPEKASFTLKGKRQNNTYSLKFEIKYDEDSERFYLELKDLPESYAEEYEIDWLKKGGNYVCFEKVSVSTPPSLISSYGELCIEFAAPNFYEKEFDHVSAFEGYNCGSIITAYFEDEDERPKSKGFMVAHGTLEYYLNGYLESRDFYQSLNFNVKTSKNIQQLTDIKSSVENHNPDARKPQVFKLIWVDDSWGYYWVEYGKSYKDKYMGEFRVNGNPL